MMIDKKPEYKGESKVWEILSDNLPGEAIVYNGREVNGREFDFCILMKNIGMIVIEVRLYILLGYLMLQIPQVSALMT